MKVIFEDGQFSFQTLRLLSEVPSGQADINEVIETARKIPEGDIDQWREEWAKTADRVRGHAENFEQQGHLITAAESYLRASNYYRAATFYTGLSLYDGCGENVKNKLEELEDSGLACFRRMIDLSGEAEPVQIPFGETALPGYFYRANRSDGKPAPALIMLNGFDGTKEEFYSYAQSARKRGLHCLTLEGPGQGEVIHKMHLPFRPDYEKVITPVVDFLIGQSGVDPRRIILWGQSFGGYLAPRAAAFEHRLAGCIANSGVYDFMGFRGGKDVDRETYFSTVASIPEAQFQAISNQMMAASSQTNWATKHGVYVFGAKDPRDFILKSKDYYLGGLASQIQCPTLVTDSNSEDNFPGQAKQLYDALRCRKDYILFSEEDWAQEHCQEGAKIYGNGCIFNWIESILNEIPE
jgi:pimeloyl-ACP methyl ester carboxylesterase